MKKDFNYFQWWLNLNKKHFKTILFNITPLFDELILKWDNAYFSVEVEEEGEDIKDVFLRTLLKLFDLIEVQEQVGDKGLFEASVDLFRIIFDWKNKQAVTPDPETLERLMPLINIYPLGKFYYYIEGKAIFLFCQSYNKDGNETWHVVTRNL